MLASLNPLKLPLKDLGSYTQNLDFSPKHVFIGKNSNLSNHFIVDTSKAASKLHWKKYIVQIFLGKQMCQVCNGWLRPKFPQKPAGKSCPFDAVPHMFAVPHMIPTHYPEWLTGPSAILWEFYTKIYFLAIVLISHELMQLKANCLFWGTKATLKITVGTISDRVTKNVKISLVSQ